MTVPHGGLEVAEAKRLKALDDENVRLKGLSDMLDNGALKDLLGKKRGQAKSCRPSSGIHRDGFRLTAPACSAPVGRAM